MQTKVCTKCKRELSIDNFSKLRDGYQLHCRECKAGYYLARRDEINQRLRDKRREKNPKEVLPEGMKRCAACNNVKPTTEFEKLSKSKDGLRYSCRECRNVEYINNHQHNIKRSKKNYEKNKDEISLKNKEYKLKHIEYYKNYDKKYYQENREKIKLKSKEYLYRKIEEDIGFKILQRCRARLYQAIKGYVKSARTQELIGCTVNELRNHLESQFKEGMSWDNYGEWHIDHIIPCASFDFSKEEDQYKCFNYTNLQPLWAEENFAKKDKIQASL